MLRTENVSLIYTNGGVETYAVRNATLTVNSNEFLGIIGPSGSGKSSLLYLLSGLKPASEGAVYFEGHCYAEMKNDALLRLRRERFGFVFQQHFLINYLTALENVLVAALPGDKGAKKRTAELLEELGLGGLLNRFPWQLSVGQRQRVAVARALINNPVVVFADEPTASLDHTTGHLVVDVLARYREKGSVVFVTHDPEMLEQANRVLRMRDGEIVG
jgi:putative ABC transport system ATP-binding protein